MKNTRLLAGLLLGAIGLSTGLSGCGTTSVESASTPSATPASQSCRADTTTTSTAPVTLTDGVGRTVKLDKPASRIAVMEWQEVEDALTLCVTPVAVADPKGYSTWVSAEKLPTKGVADVGTRDEPDIDALYAANPDLIILEGFTKNDELLKKLQSRGVPVIVARGNNPKDPVGNVKSVFNLVAKATGRTERAGRVLSDFDTNLAQRRKDVAGVKLATKKFVFLDGWLDGSNLTLRPYTDGALFTQLGKDLGLSPAWDSKVNKSYGTGGLDAQYGLAQTDIEGLTGVGDANLFYSNDSSTGYTKALTGSTIWKSLPAVKQGRAHEFPLIWGAGGPRSTTQAIDAYADLITRSATK